MGFEFEATINFSNGVGTHDARSNQLGASKDGTTLPAKALQQASNQQHASKGNCSAEQWRIQDGSCEVVDTLFSSD